MNTSRRVRAITSTSTGTGTSTIVSLAGLVACSVILGGAVPAAAQVSVGSDGAFLIRGGTVVVG
ncbi:MAG: hypothetical protein ACREMQ_21160, partial [Longimicrobiales bacterium]